MHITTDAIVLREQSADEFDSILTLLSGDRGVLSAYARGARKPRGTMRVCTELLSYSCFVLFRNKNRYAADKADLNCLFSGIRADMEKLSLASYLCRLTEELAPKEERAQEYLKLLLNCLYMLDRGKRTGDFLKPVYELRLMAMAGYMPDLVACHGCGCFEAEELFFLPLSSAWVCKECASELSGNEPAWPLTKGLLAAMRHILYAKTEKLFQFTLPPASLERLGDITERYIMTQLDKRFETLDFYYSIRG